MNECVSECVHVSLEVDPCLSGGLRDSAYVREWVGVRLCECVSLYVSV